jgi:hypothetical protein
MSLFPYFLFYTFIFTLNDRIATPSYCFLSHFLDYLLLTLSNKLLSWLGTMA